MRGIWLQSQNYVEPMRLKSFTNIYLDPKNIGLAKKFINRYKDRKNIYVCVNCFEGRDPDNSIHWNEVKDDILKYTLWDVKGIILDFIRYEKFSFNYDRINQMARFAKRACDLHKKELKFTILPSALFMGQNPWYLRRLGQVCPMLYYHNLALTELMAHLYGGEPILPAWNVSPSFLNAVESTFFNRDYSLFRYETWKDIINI